MFFWKRAKKPTVAGENARTIDQVPHTKYHTFYDGKKNAFVILLT